MRPLLQISYYSVVCLSVCLSLCLCISHSGKPWKNGWTRRDAVCGADSRGSRNHVLYMAYMAPPGEYDWTIWRSDVCRYHLL